MTLTMLMGFAAIAGILVGYLSARLGPRWLFPTALGVSLVAGLALWIWSGIAPVVDPFALIILGVGIAGPFIGCVFLAGIIGLVARRIATPKEVRE